MKNNTKNKKPSISIIVSCYNAENFIHTCLDSLVTQTINNIEIICVDDGSRDRTVEIIRDYAKKDERIIPVVNDCNVGVSKSRNKGIQLAKADYIMFCDCDDFYEPKMCEKMFNTITNSNVDIVISEINIIYKAHEEMRLSDSNYYSLKYIGTQEINDSLILNTDLSPTNKIFRKDKLDKFHIRFPEGLYYEDAYFCSAYLCCSEKIYFLKERLYNYIRHENSTMSNTWSNISDKDPAIDHLYIAFELYHFLDKNKLLKKYNSLYWELFLAFESFAINNSKHNNKKKEVRKKATSFIKKHSDSFSKVKPSLKNEIILLSTPIAINKTGIKRILIKIMPIYRISTNNIQRLRELSTKSKCLNEKVDDLLNSL